MLWDRKATSEIDNEHNVATWDGRYCWLNVLYDAKFVRVNASITLIFECARHFDTRIWGLQQHAAALAWWPTSIQSESAHLQITGRRMQPEYKRVCSSCSSLHSDVTRKQSGLECRRTCANDVLRSELVWSGSFCLLSMLTMRMVTPRDQSDDEAKYESGLIHSCAASSTCHVESDSREIRVYTNAQATD